ncbi:MAG: hypothetical protein ACLR23_05595 [Clostridia bacterium]
MTWTVTGSTSADTRISADGLLTVAADEGADKLVVKAASKENTRVSGKLEITITP